MMRHLPDIPTPSDEQSYVLGEILRFKKRVQTLGGYAGTGKTLLAKLIMSSVGGKWAAATPTGKAASVLSKRGVSAQTIHSLIYQPVKNPATGDIMRNPDGSLMFRKLPKLDVDGILVDEASMVSRDIYDDLLSYGVPVIFIGDHGQLEPVGESINLMESPDFVLETVHRNAGEIAFFCEHIRKGGLARTWSTGEKVVLVDKSSASDIRMIRQTSRVICAFNKTRVQMTTAYRDSMGLERGEVHRGEQIIVLKNRSEDMLFNGMVGKVAFIVDKTMRADTDFGVREFTFSKKLLNQVKYDMSLVEKGRIPIDYAYAVSCHRMQGSQEEVVGVVEEPSDLWDMKRWRYTAASRAVSKVVYRT